MASYEELKYLNECERRARVAEGLSIGIERAALRYIVNTEEALSSLDPVIEPEYLELAEIVRSFNPDAPTNPE